MKQKQHGLHGTKIYVAHRHMIGRCYNKKNKSFDYYGGRGITVCDRWRESFLAFVEDMGDPPSAKHQVDRIDNSGNYEPGNCRWATAKQNCNNKRNNIFFEYQGVKLTEAQWAARLGMHRATFRSRHLAGWSMDKIVNAPRASKGIEYNGETMKAFQWAQRFGLKITTFRGRLNRGWSMERIASEPPDQKFVGQ